MMVGLAANPKGITGNALDYFRKGEKFLDGRFA